MSDLDSILAEYFRLSGYVPSSTQERPDEAARLQERLKHRLVEWARRPPNVKPHPTLQQTRLAESGANDVNQQLVALGFLGDDLEYICASYLEDELRDIEMRDHEANEDATENKQLADLLEWKHDFTEFVEATIPLPDHSSERHDEILEKMRHRVPVSAQKLPSSMMYTLLNAESNATCISMVHDGVKMAVGLSDALIHVFDMGSPPSRSDNVRHKRRRFEEFDGSTACANGNLDLEMRSGDELNSEPDSTSKAGPFPTVCFRGHTKSVTSTSWFEDDGIFLSSSIDGTVRLWSENLKANICVFKGHLYPVLDVAACPVGYYFLSGSMDQTVRLWCTESMDPIRICADHTGSVDIVRWHPGCSYFGAATSDGQFRLWDVAGPKCVRLFKQPPSLIGTRSMSCFRFGPDGNSIFCGYDDGKMEIMDLRKSTEVMAVMEAHKGPIWSIDCSRGNGNLIATGGEDGSVKLWSLPDRKWVKTYNTRSCKIMTTFWTISNLLVTAGVPSHA